MPSTYTLNNGIELIGTGEQSGTWGDTTNTNLELLDTALDGQVTVTLASAGTSGSPNTLPISDGAASDGRNRMVIFDDSSDLGATAYVQLTPNDAEKIIYIRNSLSGGRDIIVFQGTYSASNDYIVPNGTTAVIYFDGGGAGAVAANVLSTLQVDALNVESDAATTAITIDNTATDGDPILGFALSGTNTFTMGVDDGDSDKFKIGTSAIGTDTRLTITSAGDIGVHTDTPDGTLHVHTGSAGTITAAAAANDFVIESDGAVGMSLLFDDTSTNAYGVIYWGNETDGASDGRLEYFGSTYVTAADRQAMLFRAGNVERLRLKGDAVVFNSTSTDTDFRVSSQNNNNMLFVNAGQDRVGVGRNDPETTLHVTASSGDSVIRVGTSGVAGDHRFDVKSGGVSTDYGLSLNDKFVISSNTSLSTVLKVGSDGTDTQFDQIKLYSSAVERMRVEDAEVHVNALQNDVDFRVSSSGYTNMLLVNSADDSVGVGVDGGTANINHPDTKLMVLGGISFNEFTTASEASLPAITQWSRGGAGQDLVIGARSSSAGLLFYTGNAGADGDWGDSSNAERLRINSDGVVIFNEVNSSTGDFYVKGQTDDNLIKVDASLNAVGIGESPINASYKLRVGGRILQNGNAVAGVVYPFNDSWTRGVGGGDLWVRIYSRASAGVQQVWFQMAHSGDNSDCLMNFAVTMAGYSFNHHIDAGPLQRYNSVHVKEIRTQTVSNTTTEVWLKVSGLSSSSGALRVWCSDANITDISDSSNHSSSEPTWVSTSALLTIDSTKAYKYSHYTSGGIYTEGNSGGYGDSIFNAGGYSRDFQVKSSGNDNMLFVDGSANKVGIGTNTPGGELTVSGTSRFEKGGSGTSLVATGSGSNMHLNTDGSAYFIFQNTAASDLYALFKGSTYEAMRFGAGSATFNEPGRDYNFAVESESTAYNLYSDGAGAGFVAVGTNNPSYNSKFSVASGTNTTVASFESALGGAGAAAHVYIGVSTRSSSGLRLTSNGSSATVNGGALAANVTNTENADLLLGANNSLKAAVRPDGDGSLVAYALGAGISITEPTFLKVAGSAADSSLRWDFVLDSSTGDWSCGYAYIIVSEVGSDASSPDAAWYLYRFHHYNGALSTVTLVDSGGATGDFTIAFSDQGGTDPITVRLQITNSKNRLVASVEMGNYYQMVSSTFS